MSDLIIPTSRYAYIFIRKYDSSVSKSLAIQTKDVFFTLDEAIRTVAREGPGSQRVINVDISKGQFLISDQENTFTWTYDTSSVLSEPGEEVTEGFLKMKTDYGNQEDKFLLTYTLNYNEMGLDIITLKDAISGPTVLTIKNEGVNDQNKIKINIAEATQLQ